MTGVAKKRAHHVVIRVSFDKPCTPRQAVDSVRDNIHGDFWPAQLRPSDPGKFIVRGVMQPVSPRERGPQAAIDMLTNMLIAPGTREKDRAGLGVAITALHRFARA